MITPRTTLSSAVALLAAGLGISGAYAHHSLTKFDGNRVVKIEGTVTAFRWVNPHVSLRIDGTADGAPAGSWAVEMNAPGVLMTDGWTSDSIATGDKVTLFVNPPREAVAGPDGSLRALYVGIVLADGRTLGNVEDSHIDTLQ
jgi:hypothetical protein